MPILVEQLPQLVLCATSAMVAPAFSDTWSHERIQVLQHEAVARFRYASRVSSQIEDRAHEEYEFEAIPLVPARVVRVKFRNIGLLPPMDLEDEVGRD